MALAETPPHLQPADSLSLRAMSITDPSQGLTGAEARYQLYLQGKADDERKEAFRAITNGKGEDLNPGFTTGALTSDDMDLLRVMSLVTDATKDGDETPEGLSTQQDLLVDAINGDIYSQSILTEQRAEKDISGRQKVITGIGKVSNELGFTPEKAAAIRDKRAKAEATKRHQDMPAQELSNRGTMIAGMFKGITPEEYRTLKMFMSNAGTGHGPWHGNLLKKRLANLDREVFTDWEIGPDGNPRPLTIVDPDKGKPLALRKTTMADFIQRQLGGHSIIDSKNVLAYNPIPRAWTTVHLLAERAIRGAMRPGAIKRAQSKNEKTVSYKAATTKRPEEKTREMLDFMYDRDVRALGILSINHLIKVKDETFKSWHPEPGSLEYFRYVKKQAQLLKDLHDEAVRKGLRAP